MSGRTGIKMTLRGGKGKKEAQPRGIAVERFAEKAFVIHGSGYSDEMMVQVVDILSNACAAEQ